MSGAVAVTLPGGYWVDGVCHREASLRPLNGDDEAFLADSADELLPAQRTTALLGRCLLRLGHPGEVGPDVARRLTIGDREALLLHLLRLMQGDRLQGVLTCPSRHCAEKMDLELRITDLLMPPYTDARERHEMVVNDGDQRYEVHARVPTGADSEAVAALALDDIHEAAATLLRRCVEAVVRDDGSAVASMPLQVAQVMPALLSERDPQAEVTFNVRCTACGEHFVALFDAWAFLLQQIGGSGSGWLLREVHTLALHYHWSEREILGLTPARRRHYLSLLSETLGQ